MLRRSLTVFIFYFDQKYISHLLLFHLLRSHLMSLDQKLKTTYIFVLHHFLYVFM